MNPNSALAQAESLLLTPFSLTEGDLSRTFGQILTHQVDYADLYFQYSRSEAWSLDEGIVKSGSFNIDQGVGVRAVAGEKTAFAYSDEISAKALGDQRIGPNSARRRRAQGESSRHANNPGAPAPRPSRIDPNTVPTQATNAGQANSGPVRSDPIATTQRSRDASRALRAVGSGQDPRWAQIASQGIGPTSPLRLR